MSRKHLLFISAAILLSPTLQINARLRFGSDESAIRLLNNAVLNCVQPLVNEEGTIGQYDTSSIVGDNNITFSNGIYENNRSNATITGQHVLDSLGTGTLRLQGSISNPKKLRGDSGMTIEWLTVAGNYNRLEGLPTFANPVQLEDATTTLTIAINSVLNKNIELNGGTIILENDLALADGVSLTGPGTIALNGRRLTFGSEDLDYTSSLYWKGAADVYLNGKIDLSGSWTFEGECYLNGHSAVLTLTSFGSLTIQENSKLFVKQMKIDGLGSEYPEHGKIYFTDGTDVSSSELHLRRAALELTSTYTFDTGHVIVETGASDVITKNHILYFENDPADKNNPPSSHLTVKDVTLYYKTRTFGDANNIRPLIVSTDLFPQPDSPIELEDTGAIVHHQTFQSFQNVTTFDISVGIDWFSFPGKDKAITRYTKDELVLNYLDGYLRGQSFNFSREPNTFQLYYSHDSHPPIVPPGPVRYYLYNGSFRGLHPKHIFYLYEDIQLVFSDGITLELKDDIALVKRDTQALFGSPPPSLDRELTDGTNSPTWIFEGNTEINGYGKTIDMEQGKIIVQNVELDYQYDENPFYVIDFEVFAGTPSRLKLQDLTLANVKNGSLQIKDKESKILFKDVKIFLAEDFYFDKGTFEIEGNVEVHSATGTTPVHFIYSTDSTTSSTIRPGATLHFDRNVTFSYAPNSSFNTLIELEDKSSVLSLKGATLYSSTVGLHLTKGTLLIDHNCVVSNRATTLSQALILGDNTSTESALSIEIMPGGSIDIQEGAIVEYREEKS